MKSYFNVGVGVTRFSISLVIKRREQFLVTKHFLRGLANASVLSPAGVEFVTDTWQTHPAMTPR